jgi:hypothetical protein
VKVVPAIDVTRKMSRTAPEEASRIAREKVPSDGAPVALVTEMVVAPAV